MPKIVISIADDDILTSNEVKMIEKFHGVRLTECESEDCISRSETIEWIENLRTLNEYYHPKSKNNHLIDCDNAIDYIKQVPSVLPKADKPRGKWIDIGIDGQYQCSNCNCLWEDSEENSYSEWVKIANYCPNCGADMREVTENE